MQERQIQIREIPVNPFLTETRKKHKTLRVAAYCRVSTEEEEQQHSFETQVAHYTEKLPTTPIGHLLAYLRMTESPVSAPKNATNFLR